MDLVEYVFIASYAKSEHKPLYLQKAVAKLDLVKFLLQIIWEIKALDDKKYLTLSERLNEIGRMLGGWLKKVSTETPSKK